MKASRKIAIFSVVAMLCLIVAAAGAQMAGSTPHIPQHWALQGELTGSDNPSYFGFSVSTSGTAIVASSGSGPAYVYVRPGAKWGSMTQTAELSASDGSDLTSVAICGNTIVAGSAGADGQAGAAYVFVEPAGGWANMTETAKLTASDATPGNYLGFSVAIAGNTIAVGAAQNNSVGVVFPVGPGAAYVFVKPTSGWSSMTETAKLTASDGVSGDDLGWKVAVLGDTVAAGAPNATIGGNGFEGAVYVFQRKGPTWSSVTETAKLTASDGGFVTVLGQDLGISGTTIAAMGLRQVYIFDKPAGGWVSNTQTAELQDPFGSHYFVQSVAISDRYVLSGSLAELNHGFTDLYLEPATGWASGGPMKRFHIPADDGYGSFGWSVGIKGTTLVIGSPLIGGTGGDIVYVYGPA